MNESLSNRNLSVGGDVDGSVLNTGDGNTFNIFHPPSIPAGDPNPFGVPYQRNSYFTGRESVLARLHEQLTQSAVTAVTQVQAISGLGGVGKTQTAVEYAYRYHYDQRTYAMVFWVKANTEANIATDFAGIANQLALPVSQSTQAEKIPAVQAWLSTHHDWLLIFDNADTPDWLAGFMPTNPQGRVLVTSRASILDQIGIRSPIALDVLSSDEAIDLLFERTGYERTDTNLTAGTELNRELDGLPLALEQASAFIVRQRIDFATYLRTYRKRGLSQLEKEKAKTGQYFSSVLKTWTINFEAVTAENPAASALLELSAFLAPDAIPYCILIAGADHLGDLLTNYIGHDGNDCEERQLALCELLALLSQYSLINWDPDQNAYSVHRLVQAVVRDEIEQTTAYSWLEIVTVAITDAYPGSEFKHWETCTYLLPHWLRVDEQAHQTRYESEALVALLSQAGVFLKDQGRYGEAELLFHRALGMYQRLLGERHPAVANSLNNLATVYSNQGRYSEAESLFRQALELNALLDENLPDVAIGLNNLAQLYCDQGNYSEAEPLYEEALELYRRLQEEISLPATKILNNLAQLYYHQGRYSEAEPMYKEVIVQQQCLLEENDPDVATSANNLARVYLDQGRYTEAEPLFRKVLTLQKQVLGDDHPNMAGSLSNLALLYLYQGRYSKAEPLFQKILDVRQRLFGEEHRDIASSLHDLALLYSNQGRYSEAESLFKQALDMYQRLLGEEHPDVANNLNSLAVLYANRRQYSKAEPLFQQALELSQRLLGNEHPHTQRVQKSLQALKYSKQGNKRQDKHPDSATELVALASLFCRQGRYRKAKSLYNQALKVCLQLLGENHPYTQSVRSSLRTLPKEKKKGFSQL